METSPRASGVLGFTRITIPLLKSLEPIPHSIPILVAYSAGAYPSRSATVMTAIWLEVVSLNVSSFCSSSLTCFSEKIAARSLTSFGGFGRDGTATAAAERTVSSILSAFGSLEITLGVETEDRRDDVLRETSDHCVV